MWREGGAARILENHWCGGPDLLIEVLSEGDRARDKLPFYAAIGTREVLIVDRDPWALELYRLERGRLVPVGVARLPEGPVLASAVVPLTLQLVPGDGDRPRIVVEHAGAGQRWVV